MQDVDNEKIIADIIDKGITKEGVVFDFNSNRSDIMFSGYSNDLASNIVITTFARRHVCIIICIPESVKSDIYNSSFALSEESTKRVEEVKRIFYENNEDSCHVTNN